MFSCNSAGSIMPPSPNGVKGLMTLRMTTLYSLGFTWAVLTTQGQTDFRKQSQLCWSLKICFTS